MRWFRGTGESSPATLVPGSKAVPRTVRRSTGLGELMRALQGRENLSVLDLGPTSAANISFLTSMGLGIYSEDMLRSTGNPDYLVTQEDGSRAIDPEKFFAENLRHGESRFDAVFCWDVLDFLPESLVRSTVDKLFFMTRPGGVLLAFFHTKDAGPDSPFYRYHIAGIDALELEPLSGFHLQRIFNNRHIETLFQDFSSRKFFLSRDNIREVLAVR